MTCRDEGVRVCMHAKETDRQMTGMGQRHYISVGPGDFICRE